MAGIPGGGNAFFANRLLMRSRKSVDHPKKTGSKNGEVERNGAESRQDGPPQHSPPSLMGESEGGGGFPDDVSPLRRSSPSEGEEVLGIKGEGLRW